MIDHLVSVLKGCRTVDFILFLVHAGSFSLNDIIISVSKTLIVNTRREVCPENRPGKLGEECVDIVPLFGKRQPAFLIHDLFPEAVIVDKSNSLILTIIAISRGNLRFRKSIEKIPLDLLRNN